MLWCYDMLCILLGALLLGTSSTSSNILSSLSDLDFYRIRSDQRTHHHASEQDTPTLILTRQLLGAGYHRELRVNIKIEHLGGYSDNNKILLVENITRDMYIDLDQVTTKELSGDRHVTVM